MKAKIFGLIRTFLFLFDEKIFCIFTNIFFACIGSGCRFHYDTVERVYIAKSPTHNWRFKNKKQGFNVYFLGLKSRGNDLAREYMISDLVIPNGSIIYDCGANVGDLFLYIGDNAEVVEYIGFEPSPEEFDCLVKNVGSKSAVNKALADTEGQIEFYVSSDNADSSYIKPANFDSKIMVETVRLDTFHRENRGSKSVFLLKLEAEGAEPEVIYGSEGILNLIKFIAADLGPERGIAGDSTFPEVSNFLLARGFSIQSVNMRRGCILFKNENLS